jgi:hypothetical protein
MEVVSVAPVEISGELHFVYLFLASSIKSRINSLKVLVPRLAFNLAFSQLRWLLVTRTDML